jgi:transposase
MQERTMIGKKDEREEIFHYFRMRDLVPDDHILKLIDKHVDFSFIREKVKHLYSETGRPSVDPELMVRMLLVGYLFGIKSERRLCEEVGMHVGYRWFVGLNMGGKVPDHSTFSKNRHGRFEGSGIWEEIFDEIVRRCIDAGLVRGGHVTADGTLVNADAAMTGMQPIVVEMKPGEYLAKLDEENREKKNDNTDGGRDDEYRNKGKELSNETHRSPVDPDARIARKGKNSDTKLRYQVGYMMDNVSRVILDASVSGLCGRGVEMELALAGLEKIKWKFKLRPGTIGADKGYAAGQFIRDAYEAGITPHVPVWDTRREHDTGIYPIERFTFDEANNRFLCPEGKALNYHGKNHKQIIWRASTKDCGSCTAKAQCTKDRSRSVSFHTHHEYIAAARKEMKTRGYKLSQRKRKKIEELFGEAKELMGFRRMKLRRLKFVIEQVLLTAAAQNIKRLVKHLEKHAPKPAQQAKLLTENPKNSFFMFSFRLSLEMLEYISKSMKSTFLFSNSYE